MRAGAGISQEELADRAGVHTSYVSQLERGIKSPTLGVMIQLASALGCTAWEMLRIAENNGETPQRAARAHSRRGRPRGGTDAVADELNGRP